MVPHTVHIVGEEWSGRAYELREVFERCAVPHDFCLADSDEGRELLAQGGSRREAPADGPSGRAGAERPVERRDRGGCRRPDRLRRARLRRRHRRRRAGGPVGGGLRRLRGAAHARRGRGRHRRAGQVELADPQLPRASQGASAGVGWPSRPTSRPPSSARASCSCTGRPRSVARGTSSAVSLADGRRVSAAVVILATGASYRRLGVPSLEALNGAGVFYGGPASEAHALSGKDVFIAGGGNSAGQAALHLARYARRVTLVVRGRVARGRDVALPGAGGRATPNVDVRTGTDGRRRGRRRPAAGAGAARAAQPATRRRSPPTRCSC